jgi:hypothetical protein
VGIGSVLSGWVFRHRNRWVSRLLLFRRAFSTLSSTASAVDSGSFAGQAFKAYLISAGSGMLSVEASGSASSPAFSGVLPGAAVLVVTGCPCLGEYSSGWGSSSV